MASLRILANQVIQLTAELDEVKAQRDSLVGSLNDAAAYANGLEDKIRQLQQFLRRIQDITVAADLLVAPDDDRH